MLKTYATGIDDPRLSADEMDERRKENVAYEYLCHLEEAKVYVFIPNLELTIINLTMFS